MDSSRAQPGLERPEIRISDPGEVAAALPHLLGFSPRESVVLVGLGGATGSRVGLTVRADIPDPRSAAAHAAAAAAGALVRALRTDQPAAALLVVVSEAPDEPDPEGMGHDAESGPLGPVPGLPHRRLVSALLDALSAVDVPVRDALLVRRGRWWSYDCPHPCCAPTAGTPLPEGVGALAAAAVTTGQVVASDREALVARLDPPPGGVAGMPAACRRIALERAARIRAVGPAVVADESWAAVEQAVARCRPAAGVSAAPLSDDDVAGLVEALRDPGVRDRALGLALGRDAGAAENLWTECTRRAPAPLDAAPATLLAVSVWLRGDGAMANVALDRALRSEPRHVLARLLRKGLDACLTPTELRSLIEQAVAVDALR